MVKPGSLTAGSDLCSKGIKALSDRFPDIRRLPWENLLVRATAFLFFALLGVGLYHQALTPDFPPHHLARLPLDEEVVLSGRLYRPSRMRPERVRLYLAVDARKSPTGWVSATGNLMVTLPVTSPPVTLPLLGTEVAVRGALRQPRTLLNPGSWNQPRHLAADGIYRQMHLSDSTHLVLLASSEAPSVAERLRAGVRRLLQGMAPTTRAMYLAMLLGDQGEVTPEMRRLFSRTGTSHLLAISGLHLGALAAVTYFLVFGILKCFPRLLLRVNGVKIATVAATVPVVSYAHLAGGSPATQRAEVMVLVGLFLIYWGRIRDVWSALTIAAFLILIWSPLLLFSLSFQLSFAAVFGIFYLVPPGYVLDQEQFQYKSKQLDQSRDKSKQEYPKYPFWHLYRYWCEVAKSISLRAMLRGVKILGVSLAASLATAPLVAHYFQVVSLYGFLVNLVAIPLVLMLSLPLGGLAVLAQGLGITPLAKILLDIGQIPLNWGYHLITWVAKLPGSGVIVPSPTWLQVGLIYGLIFSLVRLHSLLLVFKISESKQLTSKSKLLSWFLIFKREPSQKRRIICTKAGQALSAAILTAVLLLPGWHTFQRGEITVLDSYTGLDGVLVAPGGQRVAVTAAYDIWPGWKGGGMGPLPGYLQWRQFRHLDAVLALNLNARNAQEMLTLAEQFDIGGFWWRGRRPVGKVVDLMNLLGDAGRPGLSLDRMNPPTSLGGMSLAYPTWDRGWGVALKITYQGRQALILPPLRQTVVEKLPWPEDSPLAVLVAPGDVPPSVVARLKPKSLVFYGSRGPEAGNVDPSRPPTYLTREGAVTLTFTEKGASFRQWRP